MGTCIGRRPVYFIRSLHQYPSIAFGSRVDNVQDPVTGLVVSLVVEGEYSLRVIDPPSLLTNLTGTIDVTDNSAISSWSTQQLLKVLRGNVTQQIVNNGWPILGLAAHTPEVEKDVVGLAAQQLVPYGLTIARLGNFDISLDPRDEIQLKSLARDTAYSRLAGSYQQYAAGALSARRRGRLVSRWPSAQRRVSCCGPRRRQPSCPAAQRRRHSTASAGVRRGCLVSVAGAIVSAPRLRLNVPPVRQQTPRVRSSVPSCGTALPTAGSGTCAECAAPLVAGGAHFCSTCGRPV